MRVPPMSGEREVWEVWDGIEPLRDAEGMTYFPIINSVTKIQVARTTDDAIRKQIVREHNAYQDAVEALEKWLKLEDRYVSISQDDYDTEYSAVLLQARAALQSIKEQGA